MKKDKIVLQVLARYNQGHQVNGKKVGTTGHWIMGKDFEDILRIAEKHNIGYPMGSDEIRMHTINQTCFTFNPKTKYKGSVWEEVDGKLVKHTTPLVR